VTTRTRLTPQQRRQQIVASAISVLAEVGYADATFARIARAAGLSSTGLISYHFAERADLMRAVVTEVYREAFDHIRPRMDAQTSPSAILREFILASVEFYAAHPDRMVAITVVRGNLRRPDGKAEFGRQIHEPELAELQEVMVRGQRAGEMGEFDTRVAAVSLRNALDGAAVEVRGPDAADPVRYGWELARLFARATGQREVRSDEQADSRAGAAGTGPRDR
jgi:TetR/AcrR family transcriptional regulator, fatty acid metabolism regulator protein